MATSSSSPPYSPPTRDWLHPLRRWLDQLEVRHLAIARLICFLIPPSCPFARDVRFGGRHLFHIPPLCHFNPVYGELMSLRFRALSFLESYPSS
jgi:hypothetical protein